MEQATLNRLTNLDEALSPTEREAVTAVAAVTRLQSVAKKIQTAARTGDLRELHKNLEAISGSLQQAALALDALKESWPYTEAEEQDYLASPAYSEQLLAAATAAGLNLQPQEGAIACYPSLLKVVARERSLYVDRKPYRQLRPGQVVGMLLKRQKQPAKLNLPKFLEVLQSAYDHMTGGKRGEMVRLIDVYQRLTVLPWVQKEYSLQEFARDVYLLDASRELTAKDGGRCRLHPGATGAKKRSNLLIVVTRDGVERTYYGLEFSGGEA